jgi:hypothetical protein
MFRSSKILKLAFVVLGAVVLLSSTEVEAAKMRPQGVKTLLQEATITPGSTNTEETEKGRPVAVAAG